jgi:hypothetical protein
MTDKTLDLEVRLLILRYGRRRIIDALAGLGEQTVEELESELAAAFERKARRNDRPEERSASDIIAEACRDRPEIGGLVTTLVNRFENRTFLPQLRDVVRFLDRAGISHGKLKSRRASVSKLISALASLNASELRQLASPPQGESDNDFALLAREIMTGGKPHRPARDGA